MQPHPEQSTLRVKRLQTGDQKTWQASLAEFPWEARPRAFGGKGRGRHDRLPKGGEPYYVTDRYLSSVRDITGMCLGCQETLGRASPRPGTRGTPACAPLVPDGVEV